MGDRDSRIFLYRITHIDNLTHMKRFGITHVNSPNKNISFIGIGDESLIQTRENVILPKKEKLADYIPFYFAPRMPMLYVIQNGYNGVNAIAPQEIVYCITDTDSIIQAGLDFVYTDGHAVSNLSSFYYSTEIDKIKQVIDWNAVRSRYWNDENDLDFKRKKEAEFLIKGDIPFEAILGFAVFDNSAKEKVIEELNGASKKVVIKPNYYF